jgi:glucuronate isomerase
MVLCLAKETSIPKLGTNKAADIVLNLNSVCALMTLLKHKKKNSKLYVLIIVRG